MQKRQVRHFVKNSTGDGYECYYEFNNKLYNYNSLKTVEHRIGNACTRTVYSVDTGEMLSKKVFDIISHNNSIFYMYKNGFEIAKDKNVPRIKVKSDGKHIKELCKEYENYLQISTGSQHDKRGIIVADIDLNIPKEFSGNVEKYVNSVLKKRFDCMDTMNLSKPTAYQIHLTNGHVQLYWMLEKEIVVKKYKMRIVNDYDEIRKEYYMENTSLCTAYKRVMNFYAYVFDGDFNFTGWQIKNPYVKDEVFIDSFQTYWFNGDTYTKNEPSELTVYPFNDLHESVYDILENCDKMKILENLLEKKTVSKKKLEDLICNDFEMAKSVQKKYGIRKRKKKISISEGRNQYVRRKTYEYIRIYNNELDIIRCRKMVKSALENALNEHGKLSGTKNNNIYTDNDFERDFKGAYYHAITTYVKSNGYTDEQRRRSIRQRKDKKNVQQIAMLAVLSEHPELIPSNKKNNETIIRLINEYDNKIVIKSHNTINNYKNQLGIKNDQKKLNSKNYKKAGKDCVMRIERTNELIQTFDVLNKDIMSYERKEKWNKRISDITSNEKVSNILEHRKV